MLALPFTSFMNLGKLVTLPFYYYLTFIMVDIFIKY